MTSHYLMLEQLGWPRADFDAILAEIEMREDDPVAYLCKNLWNIPPRARYGVVHLLNTLGDRRALSALMRYVFDARGQVEEADARALAMRAIIAIADAGPPDCADRRRVASFLTDMVDESDGFVRGLVMSGLGHFGSQRALKTLKGAFGDPHPFAADQARAAYRMLSDRAQQSGGLPDERSHRALADEVLLDRIRYANIQELEAYLDELRERPDILALIDRFLSSGNKRNHYLLGLLPEINDAAARPIVARHLDVAADETSVVAALDVLTHFLRNDATQLECAAIEKGLRSQNPHIQRAALRTAGVAGSDYLLEGVVAALSSTDPRTALAAATAMERAPGPGDEQWLAPLRNAFGAVHQRRIRHELPADIQTEALLLGCLTQLSACFEAPDLRNEAFLALETADEHREIRVAALRLLLEITPADGLPEGERWTPRQAHSLLRLLREHDEAITSRLIDLLSRGAPDNFERGVDILVDSARHLSGEDRAKVVRLIGRSGHPRVVDFLYQFVRNSNDDVAEAASEGLQRLNIGIETMPPDIVDILLKLDERTETRYFKKEFERLERLEAERLEAERLEAERLEAERREKLANSGQDASDEDSEGDGTSA